MAAAGSTPLISLDAVVIDTETTGLDPNQGHRLVELGCVELLNRIPAARSAG
jgi:DNA polymerase III epsilon subunit-like protein